MGDAPGLSPVIDQYRSSPDAHHVWMYPALSAQSIPRSGPVCPRQTPLRLYACLTSYTSTSPDASPTAISDPSGLYLTHGDGDGDAPTRLGLRRETSPEAASCAVKMMQPPWASPTASSEPLGPRQSTLRAPPPSSTLLGGRRVRLRGVGCELCAATLLVFWGNLLVFWGNLLVYEGNLLVFEGSLLVFWESLLVFWGEGRLPRVRQSGCLLRTYRRHVLLEAFGHASGDVVAYRPAPSNDVLTRAVRGKEGRRERRRQRLCL